MKTILIVDDSAYMRMLIRLTAEQYVKVVGEATNGQDGVAQYMALLPDIVTMDLNMDHGDGIGALRRIMEHNAAAKVIVISSMAGQEPLVTEATRLGAVKIFDKSVINTKFAEYIREISV